MIRPVVLYLAAPLTGDFPGNAARARRWLRWLMDRVHGVAFCCPWLPFVDVQDNASEASAARALRDCRAIARQCDGIVMVGAAVSIGMLAELDEVRAAGGVVYNLTALGSDPRNCDEDRADRLIAKIIEETDHLRARAAGAS